MKAVVGLGNPGDKYENSRHNIGFMTVDVLLKHFEPLKRTFWDEEKKGKLLLKKIKSDDHEFFLAKPQTFMNNSGAAVSYLLSYYKIDPKALIVIYDDLDLPFGRIRVRFGGAAGGHRGVESIIGVLKTDAFLRVRLGIGHPSRDHDGNSKEGKSRMAVEDYVLSNFSSSEKGKVRHMIKEAIHALNLIFEHGLDKYMSKYNNEAPPENKNTLRKEES